MGANWKRRMNATGLTLAALIFLQLSGCASSPSMRAYELAEEGKFGEAAKLRESEAERYRKELNLWYTNSELREASHLYVKAGDLTKARELAQSRVNWWDVNGGGKVTTFRDGVVLDTLADTAEALAAVADVCAKARDAACVASAGERITKLFDSRAVSTLYGRGLTNSSAVDYARSLETLARAHASVGQQDLALRAKVLELSTANGLDELGYSSVIYLAKKSGNLALAEELGKRYAALKKTPFIPGGKSEDSAMAYLRKSDNPRIDSQKYADWAKRLEKSDGGVALAAIARIQSAAAAREADQRESQLRDSLKAQEAREASRRESEELNKQLNETLRVLQSMQPMR